MYIEKPSGAGTRAYDDCASVANIYLGRQPIVDRSGALVAYELLFRQGGPDLQAVLSADGATAQVAENTLVSFGLDAVLGGHLGYINVGANLLMSDALEALPPERFMLEILEDVAFDDTIIQRCKALRGLGYRLALDDVTPLRTVPEAVLSSIDLVKIDLIDTPAAQLPELVERFRRSRVPVLAEKVETRDAFEHTKLLGCSLFQGYFFARPEVLVSRKARTSHGPLLRVMRLLHNEPRIDELEEALKGTPDIVMQVFRLANAVASADHARVQTLRAAIGRVGTERLTRWIQILMYTRSCDVPLCANPLVQLVGTRARFMELAAHQIGHGKASHEEFASHAYLVGMLSLAHVLLQMDVAQMLAELQLAPEVGRALALREGELGALLAVAEALETQNEAALEACARRWPTLGPEVVARLGVDAARWAAHQVV